MWQQRHPRFRHGRSHVVGGLKQKLKVPQPVAMTQRSTVGACSLLVRREPDHPDSHAVLYSRARSKLLQTGSGALG
jgi:hypothetical protein